MISTGTGPMNHQLQFLVVGFHDTSSFFAFQFMKGMKYQKMLTLMVPTKSVIVCNTIAN